VVVVVVVMVEILAWPSLPLSGVEEHRERPPTPVLLL